MPDLNQEGCAWKHVDLVFQIIHDNGLLKLPLYNKHLDVGRDALDINLLYVIYSRNLVVGKTSRLIC